MTTLQTLGPVRRLEPEARRSRAVGGIHSSDEAARQPLKEAATCPMKARAVSFGEPGTG
jgi:hypothetical protein